MEKYNRSDIKLSFVKNETKFFVNENKGVVVCTVISELRVPYAWNSPIQMNSILIKGKGVAKCHTVDKFDEERGKRVALAKAENMCYNEAMIHLRNQLEHLDFMSDCIFNFIDKGVLQCAHNNEYIERVSDKEHPDYKEHLSKIKHGVVVKQ